MRARWVNPGMSIRDPTKMEFVTINGIFRSFRVGVWEGLMSEGVLVDSDIRTELQ